MLLVPGTTKYAIPVMDQARILKVNDRGLLVTGMEIFPTTRGIKNVKSDDFPQTWWCEFRNEQPPV